MNLCKGNHVFAFETLPCSHALLIGSLESLLAQMLDQSDEYVFRVVLFKSQVRVAQDFPLHHLLFHYHVLTLSGEGVSRYLWVHAMHVVT